MRSDSVDSRKLRTAEMDRVTVKKKREGSGIGYAIRVQSDPIFYLFIYLFLVFKKTKFIKLFSRFYFNLCHTRSIWQWTKIENFQSLIQESQYR